MSSDQGYFVIPALHPSTYDVTVSASGFATHAQNGVSLLADQSLTLDIRMTIGQITETVSIQTSGVQVDTSTSTLSQVVEEKRIVDLPLNGRNPVTLALLVPGTSRLRPTEQIKASTRRFLRPSLSRLTAHARIRPASTWTALRTMTSIPT
jgi:hypothetical protein